MSVDEILNFMSNKRRDAKEKLCPFSIQHVEKCEFQFKLFPCVVYVVAIGNEIFFQLNFFSPSFTDAKTTELQNFNELFTLQMLYAKSQLFQFLLISVYA